MTEETTESPQSNPPLGLGCNEGLGPLQPKRAETQLGVHWLGGLPYMLVSTGRVTPEQRARLISSGPNAGRVRRDDKGAL